MIYLSVNELNNNQYVPLYIILVCLVKLPNYQVFSLLNLANY